jgi:hypothetical protein
MVLLWASSFIHLLDPKSALDQNWHYRTLWREAHIDYRKAQEFRRVLKRHQEYIKCNIFFVFGDHEGA